MAKIHSIHEIVLTAGTSGEEFERFFNQEVLSAPQLSGARLHLWKGDRGERAGKYAIVIELDSVETRDRHFPSEEQLGEEAQQLFHLIQPLIETMTYTDYVAVES